MSKVSVIVPVYNVEAYLSHCIESIQQQTESDIEIILVDDGSPDTCGEICDRFAEKDARIQVIHQENAGQGVARNTGLAAAHGEYVLFVDSDDWIEPDLVETAFAAAKKFDAEMLIFDLQATDAQGNSVYRSAQKIPTNTLLSAKTDKSFLLTDPSPCNKLLKRSWLLENQFAFPKMYYEDLIAITCLDSAVERGVYIGGKPLYNYFLRQNSTLHNGDAEKTAKKRIAAVNEIYRFYKGKNLAEFYHAELEWIVLYHGFFLPAREILNFTAQPFAYIDELYDNANKICSIPQKNPYFKTLAAKERLIFRLLYGKHYFLTKLFWKLNAFLKKIK